MNINFKQSTIPSEGIYVVFGFDGEKLSTAAKKLDGLAGGAISRAQASERYEGKFGQSLKITGLGGVDGVNTAVLVGLGKEDALDDLKLQKIGGKIISGLQKSGIENISIAVDSMSKSGLAVEEVAANIGYGVKLRSYHFDKYFTKKTDAEKPSVLSVDVLSSASKKAEAAFEGLNSVASGVFMARDLVTEPGNVVYPESYAELIKELSDLGVEVEILGEDEMEELGMGALLGVGQGSACESKLAIMRWNGGKKNQQPLAFIGKGVTFDTGGISLKPGAGMEDMKFDMGGSAAVVGLMKALAGRNASVNAIGAVGLVENMPSSTAQRPGDVVTSMSGQTIEVINTDAEGRLVLCDVLWYIQDRFKPKFMIDLATLTGAMLISLGHEFAGIFSNNDELCEQLSASGEAVDEPVWRMPLTKEFDKLIDSQIADMKNLGGRYAGSITAAQFLQRFVNDVPWVHIDIAGTAWKTKPSDLAEKGATGYGVRLLDRMVRDYYE